MFPISLAPELVICDCAWECINAWRRRKDKNEAIELLEVSLFLIVLLLCNSNFKRYFPHYNCNE